MPIPLLDYYKEVLAKISHADRRVFRKELRKAFRRLDPIERSALKEWFRAACLCKLEPTNAMDPIVVARESGLEGLDRPSLNLS